MVWEFIKLSGKFLVVILIVLVVSCVMAHVGWSGIGILVLFPTAIFLLLAPIWLMKQYQVYQLLRYFNHLECSGRHIVKCPHCGRVTSVNTLPVGSIYLEPANSLKGYPEINKFVCNSCKINWKPNDPKSLWNCYDEKYAVSGDVWFNESALNVVDKKYAKYPIYF